VINAALASFNIQIPAGFHGVEDRPALILDLLGTALSTPLAESFPLFICNYSL
jgi:hypothetical protein